jgi:hypothetical protein
MNLNIFGTVSSLTSKLPRKGRTIGKTEVGFTLEVKLGGTSWHLIYITPLPKILNFPKFID